MERNFSFAQARRLQALNRSAEAIKEYDRAYEILGAQTPNWQGMDPHALVDYGLLREHLNLKREKTAKVAELACKMFANFRLNKHLDWQGEVHANHLLLRNSQDSTLLKALGKRMRAAADDKQLPPKDHVMALVMAGSALSDLEMKGSALALMRKAQVIAAREGVAPHGLVAHAIHAMLDKQLISDPKEQLKMARYAYENQLSIKHTRPGAFAVSAAHLGAVRLNLRRHCYFDNLHHRIPHSVTYLLDELGILN